MYFVSTTEKELIERLIRLPPSRWMTIVVAMRRQLKHGGDVPAELRTIPVEDIDAAWWNWVKRSVIPERRNINAKVVRLLAAKRPSRKRYMRDYMRQYRRRQRGE